MDILIDNQKVVSVEADLLRDEDGDLRIVIAGGKIGILLDAWRDMDPSRRDYVFGDEDREAALIIAEYDTRLALERFEPFWTGRQIVDGYDLGIIGDLLGDELRWGEEIGSPDPLAGAR